MTTILIFIRRVSVHSSFLKAGTPYDGGIFEIDFSFPAEYPFKAPKV